MNFQHLNPNGTYYAYLRKSRKDLDLEALGEGETLARHQKMLTDLAASLGISISKFYKEIVSGETIADRPVVQELLRDISSGACDGVLVTEVERLARGDTSDQGTIANYFRLSNTLIITPLKVYDPNDEYDEEYFEFGLFMSRREYKIINRRIQRGRVASAKEGKWVTSSAPFGYERVRITGGKGYTLKIVPEQAEIVHLIYDLYTKGELQEDGSYQRLGFHRISKRLDSMGIKPVCSTRWSPSTIKDMITNPSYIGMVTFGKEHDKEIIEDGKRKKVRVHMKDYELYKGLHPAIISREQYDLAQNLIASRPTYPVVSNKVLKNPLAGLIYCSQCGSRMTRLGENPKTPYPALKCPNRYCTSVSSPLYLVEDKLINAIREWLTEYQLTWTDDKVISNQIAVRQNAIASRQAEADTLKEQKDKAYDFLEQGIYTPEVFAARMSTLDKRLQEIALDLDRLETELKKDQKKNYEINTFIPRVEHVLETYWSTNDATTRNNMLKDVLERAEYTKTEQNRKGNRDNANFTLTLTPNLPDD